MKVASYRFFSCSLEALTIDTGRVPIVAITIATIMECGRSDRIALLRPARAGLIIVTLKISRVAKTLDGVGISRCVLAGRQRV